MWTIGPPGRQIHLRDDKGLTHIARLLAAPHIEFHALDLIVSPQTHGPGSELTAMTGIAICVHKQGDYLPLLNPRAMTEYRQRIKALQEAIDEAESFNDPDRASRARQELAFLSRELAGAVVQHSRGRDCKTSLDAKRARIYVTRAIRMALNRVSEHDAVLGRRLRAAIRTGTFCVYEPAPGNQWTWDLKGPHLSRHYEPRDDHV